MSSGLEIAANVIATASIILAGRNNVHTWWTGIIGCALFAWVFRDAKLYADAVLQLFFIAASIGGWWNWCRETGRAELPVRRTPTQAIVWLTLAGVAAAALYSGALIHYTDAAAPVPDSTVLAFSVMGQFLLMGRRIETWWCWIIVNIISVPLYISRGLHLTAILYAVYLINALIALRVWRRKLKPYQRGLVVGKFCPLHLGHESVIRRALELCNEVIVISYTNPEFPGCEPARRRAWLAARFPEVRAIVLESGGEIAIPDNDADPKAHRRLCGRVCRETPGVTVDAVFTSEDYGDGFAADLTEFFRESDPSHPVVSHVMVDAGREEWPVSGSLLRDDIHGNRRFLAPEVYASFVQRAAFIGGESSGKTVLAAALAEAMGTVWVPEYGRELWEARAGKLEEGDMREIVREQIVREEKALLRANRFVFCDTTPLTTLFYSLDMFGRAADEVMAGALRDYHFVFLCAPDFPFVQDGTRRDAAFRQRQHEWYLTELARRGVAWRVVTGSLTERVKMVQRHLQGCR